MSAEEVKQEIIENDINSCTKEEKSLYKKLLNGINKALVSADKEFLKVACCIWEIDNKKLFRAGQYKNIVECIQDIYDIKKTMTYGYIAIVEKFFDKDENNHPTGLNENFKDFGLSQLSVMIHCPENLLEDITSDMSVRAIKDFIARSKETVVQEKVEENEQLEMNLPEDTENDIDWTADEDRVFIASFDSITEMNKLEDLLNETMKQFRKDERFKKKKLTYNIFLSWE